MKAQVLSPSPENIGIAAAALRAGGVVAMPTETVYGLAADAFSTEALTKVFKTKERPTFDPLIVHVAEAIREAAQFRGDPLEALAAESLIDLGRMQPAARDRARMLIRKYWPGPLTLILPKNSKVPDLATSGLMTVALRMPRHPVAQALLEAAATPLAAPSANRFGRISPTRAEDVLAELGDRIEWILDGGSCEIGLESTVLSIAEDGSLRLLRPGAVTRAELEAATGAPVELNTVTGTALPTSLLSPGLLLSHYAPRKPLHLLSGPVASLTRKEDYPVLKPGTRIGLLLQTETASPDSVAKLLNCPVIPRILSRDGHIEEIARNLFAGLRTLDESEAEVLLAEPPLTEEGLGYAVLDRLRRASAGTSAAPAGRQR